MRKLFGATLEQLGIVGVFAGLFQTERDYLTFGVVGGICVVILGIMIQGE
jgi:hypothetical protein